MVIMAPASSFTKTLVAKVRVSHRKIIILTPVQQTIMKSHQSLRNPVRTKFCFTAEMVEVEEVVELLLP